MAMSDMAGREPSTAHGAASEAQRREGLRYEEDLRRIVVSPFDLIYTYYPEEDLARVEALVHQRAAR